MEGRCHTCKSWQKHFYRKHIDAKGKKFLFFFRPECMSSSGFGNHVAAGIPRRVAEVTHPPPSPSSLSSLFPIDRCSKVVPLLPSESPSKIISEKFIKQCKLEGAKAVDLKGPSGCTWRVKLRKAVDYTFHGDVWRQFVSQNQVERGDNLVFEYVGDSCFGVSMFDGGGLEKIAPFFAKDNFLGTKVNQREQSEDDSPEYSSSSGNDPQECSSSENYSPEGSSSSGSLSDSSYSSENDSLKDPYPPGNLSGSRSEPTPEKCLQSKKRKKAENYSPEDSSSSESLSDSSCSSENDSLKDPYSPGNLPGSRSGPTPEKCLKSNKRKKAENYSPEDSSSSGSLSDSSCSSENDSLKDPHSPGNLPGSRSGPTPEKCLKSNKRRKKAASETKLGMSSSKQEKMGKPTSSSVFVSKRRPVTAAERGRAISRACKIRLSNPSFLTVMLPSHVCRRFFMTIPPGFAGRHITRVQQTIILRLPDQKREWHVDCGLRARSSGLYGITWRQFVNDNNLKEGDACVFELTGSPSVLAMHVHIFRVVEKIEPLTVKEKK